MNKNVIPKNNDIPIEFQCYLECCDFICISNEMKEYN